MSTMQQTAVQGPSVGRMLPGVTMDSVSSLLQVLLRGAERAWLTRLLLDTDASPTAASQQPGHDTNVGFVLFTA